MWLIDQLAEARIAEAIENGEFKGLPGEGAPLDLDADVMVPEALRPAYRILRNSGYIPPELALRREISDVSQLLASLDEGPGRANVTRRLNLLQIRLSACRRWNVDLRAEQAYYQKLTRRMQTR